MTAATPAGFWRRYAAYSLDAAVLGALAAILAWSRIVAGVHAASLAAQHLTDLAGRLLVDALMQGAAPETLLHEPRLLAAADGVQAALLRATMPWLLAYAVLALAWHVGGELSPWRGSPGKRALQLEVVTAEAQAPLGLGRALARHAGALLSWLTLNLGHALAAVPPQKRALHDYLAGARVLCRASSTRLPAWAMGWLALQALALFGGLAWMLARYAEALRAAAG